jgi:hypothetical protein
MSLSKNTFLASSAAKLRGIGVSWYSVKHKMVGKYDYKPHGKLAELVPLVADEVCRQTKVSFERKEKRQSKDPLTVEAQGARRVKASQLAAERRVKASQLADERRRTEKLTAYTNAAAARLESAVDLRAARAARSAELAALELAIDSNRYGDFVGWVDGVKIGYEAGPRHACGVRYETMDGWSGSYGSKYNKPIKHVIYISSQVLDRLHAIVKKFEAPPKGTWTFGRLPKAVRAACMGWARGGMCQKCDGEGLVSNLRDSGPSAFQCPVCGGSGKLKPKRSKDVASVEAAMTVAKNGGDEQAMLVAANATAKLNRDFVDPAEAVQEAAMNLGLRGDSTLAVALLHGNVGEEEASRIAEKTAHRHNNTDYENLLTAGMNREDARACMTETR